jgi:hypothetical protein
MRVVLLLVISKRLNRLAQWSSLGTSGQQPVAGASECPLAELCPKEDDERVYTVVGSSSTIL